MHDGFANTTQQAENNDVVMLAASLIYPSVLNLVKCSPLNQTGLCMSLDVDGFTNEIEGSEVIVKVDSNHKLLQLARTCLGSNVRHDFT